MLDARASAMANAGRCRKPATPASQRASHPPEPAALCCASGRRHESARTGSGSLTTCTYCNFQRRRESRHLSTTAIQLRKTLVLGCVIDLGSAKRQNILTSCFRYSEFRFRRLKFRMSVLITILMYVTPTVLHIASLAVIAELYYTHPISIRRQSGVINAQCKLRPVPRL
jgi:hypothetical protein